MRLLKMAVLTPVLVGLLSTGAVAGQYGKYGSGAAPQAGGGAVEERMEGQVIPGHPGFFRSEDMFYHTGTLTAIDRDRQEIYIRTTVPGLLGPQERDFPFRIEKDTTVSICIKSLNACDSRASGLEGWQLLNNLESFTTLSATRKNVVVVGEPETNRIVHVQIEYDI